jgi:hypothetical protein
MMMMMMMMSMTIMMISRAEDWFAIVFLYFNAFKSMPRDEAQIN